MYLQTFYSLSFWQCYISLRYCGWCLIKHSSYHNLNSAALNATKNDLKDMFTLSPLLIVKTRFLFTFAKTLTFDIICKTSDNFLDYINLCFHYYMKLMQGSELLFEKVEKWLYKLWYCLIIPTYIHIQIYFIIILSFSLNKSAFSQPIYHICM